MIRDEDQWMLMAKVFQLLHVVCEFVRVFVCMLTYHRKKAICLKVITFLNIYLNRRARLPVDPKFSLCTQTSCYVVCYSLRPVKIVLFTN